MNATAAQASREEMRVRVYTPESALRNPGRLFSEMFADLWASRELAWRLFVRDTSAKYRQSMLGYLWAFLPPVANTLTFVLLNRSGVFSGGDPRVPYPLFVMIGTLLWQVFADAATTPSKVVTSSRSMLAKINFPREALLLAALLEVLFNFVIRLVLVVPLYAWLKMAPPASFAFVFPGVLAILCVGLMIGVMLTPIGVLYSDVGQALTIGLTFWMLLTPVVYTPPAKGMLALISRWNPTSPLIVTTRELMTVGAATDVVPALCVTGAALVLLFGGWVLYRLAMPILVERMGN